MSCTLALLLYGSPTVQNKCKNNPCGRGECVITQSPPYYHCACKHPYRGPHCSTVAPACRPNPCQNGGTCSRHRRRSKFTCTCPNQFKGRFCEIGMVPLSPLHQKLGDTSKAPRILSCLGFAARMGFKSRFPNYYCLGPPT